MNPSKEQTCQKKKGNGFFIVHKDNVNRATNYLDHELQALYQHTVPNKLRFDKISIPRRTNNRAQRTVGSYAEVLLNRANPQEEEVATTWINQSLLINPLYCLKFASTLLNLIATYGAIFKRQTSM